MAFADIGEVRLFFTDEGGGDPALLFVHGYTCDSHDWSWQLPFFAAEHRVIAVDLRGHGRSSAPMQNYSVADFAADLTGLLAVLKVDSVVGFGHSLGAGVVSTMAVERPDLIAGLVCVDPAYLIPDEVVTSAESFRAALAAGDPAPLVQQLLGGLDSPGRTLARRTWHQRRAAGVPPHVLRQAYECSVRGLALLSNSESYLVHRTCPVLSFYADPARVATESALFRDPRSHAIGWEGAGHWLHQERPTEFNALVANWLTRL